MRFIILLALLFASPVYAQRIIVTSNPNVYFAPATGCAGGYWGSTANPVTNCGSDTLGDGSMAHPWATPQLAVDHYYQAYDFAGQYAPTLNLACAAAPGQFYYPGIMVSGLMVGQPGGFPPLPYGDGTPPFPLGLYAPVQILGCVNNQFGVFLNPNPAAGRPATIGLVVAGGARVRVSGLSIDTTNAQQDCLDVFNAVLDMDHVVFGNASNDEKRIHIGIFQGAIVVNGDLAIAGNASSWIEAGQQASVLWNTNGIAPNMTVRYLGGSFSNGFIYANNGNIALPHVSFVHSTLNTSNQFVDDSTPVSIPGTVVVANQNGVIETGQGCTSSYFPTNSTPGGVQISIQDHATCR